MKAALEDLLMVESPTTATPHRGGKLVGLRERSGRLSVTHPRCAVGLP